MIDSEGPPNRMVMHCFSGMIISPKRASTAARYLSFAGTITFKNNDHLRDALIAAPIDRILVETDAPYLTPMPLRGRPNASYLIPAYRPLPGRDTQDRSGAHVSGAQRQCRRSVRRELVGRWSSDRCCAGAG